MKPINMAEPWITDHEIKIVKEKRLEFGSLFMEGFTYFIWKIS